MNPKFMALYASHHRPLPWWRRPVRWTWGQLLLGALFWSVPLICLAWTWH
jgi:hypothetical protein